MKLLQKCKNDVEISEEIHLKDICNCKDAREKEVPSIFHALLKANIYEPYYTHVCTSIISYHNKKIIKFKIYALIYF